MSITTIYDGIEYRSRLEAKWAAFFTRIGWRFTYEPFDGDGYIPDFLIHGDLPMLVEVKPAVTRTDYQAPIAKITRGLASHWTHDILIVGADPISSLPKHRLEPENIGLMGELVGDGEWTFSPAIWITCLHCRTAAVHHEHQSYASRPCGHYDGDGYCGQPDVSILQLAWAAASNDVKWRGTKALDETARLIGVNMPRRPENGRS